jgi:hypothetical protein
MRGDTIRGDSMRGDAANGDVIRGDAMRSPSPISIIWERIDTRNIGSGDAGGEDCGSNSKRGTMAALRRFAAARRAIGRIS